MRHYIDKFEKYNEAVLAKNIARPFDNIEKAAPYPYADVNGRRCVIWCSNDYLCLSRDRDLIDLYVDTVKVNGIGSGGTRNITGNSIYHTKLERKIAKFHNQESAAIFTSAYIANVGAIWGAAKLLEDLIIFSDSDNHASIIHGIRVSRAEKFVFPNCDYDTLEQAISLQPKQRNKLIVIESIYSMSGIISDLERVIDISKKYNALVYVDEVHAIGLYGDIGSGILSDRGLEDQIWAINGTFGKSFGMIGGYIASDYVSTEALKSISPPFIFTTSLPTAMCITAIKAVDKIAQAVQARKTLHTNVSKLIQALNSKENIKYESHGGHIVSINIGDEKKCDQIARYMLEHNIYVRSIKYPTVKMSNSKLRICISSYHTDSHINQFAAVLSDAVNNV